MRKAVIAVIPLLLKAALAEAPPVTDWAPNETVVVSAEAPGPAFWHIKKDDSEIWVLGVIGPMPRGTTWNSNRTAEIIDGARVVLAPPEATAGLFESSWFLLTHRGLLSMPGDEKLEDTLPPDLKTRFVAARTALNLKADHFEDDPPIIAAWKLETNFNEQHKLGVIPGPVIAKIAKDKHVPMHPIGSYGALGLLKDLLRLPQDQQQTCLRLAIADTEARAMHAGAAATAWTVGDIKGIKAHYTQPFLPQCAGSTASFAKIYSRSVADYLAAIDEALSKPGKVVMIVEIGALLRNTGVVQKLHEQGVTIEGPTE